MDVNSANFILVSRINFSDPQNGEKINEILSRQRDTDVQFPRSVYVHDGEDNHFVELVALNEMAEFAEYCRHKSTLKFIEEISPFMHCDIRRELIEIKDIVKKMSEVLPVSHQMQMRYIEVPLNVMEDYHHWRKETIFKNILKRDEIKGFIAYHSVISTIPGVTFFVDYDCTPEQLTAGFKGPHYQQIIEQAPRYVLHDTLSTRFYTLAYTSITQAKELSRAVS